ncbi:MAG: hypothetical protein IJF74_00055, partial [Clostridia bacterium]|nr:hypothetical protein [Clostridia bacterium]
MLYNKNKNSLELDRQLFKNPTAEYRGAPFWAWNSKLEKEELVRQINIFNEMGIGGFHMHCRQGLETPYLSDEFMELVRACDDKAKENGMLAWLYDEDKWPSGFGGGYVTKDEEYRQRFIVFTCDPDFRPRPSSVLIARFDVVLDRNKCLKSYKKVGDGDNVEGTLWSVWRMIAVPSPWHNNQTYVDTLNKKAIERFIEVTHERYYETVGESFGKTVPAIFTDEPQFLRKDTLPYADSKKDVRLPWTDDIEQSFTASYGVSLIDSLPELLWDLPDGAVSVARYRYHDHISERFASAFADTLGSWCDAHGIALTGHMMEEPTLARQTKALGDCMRSYRSFGIPGIDMLCANIELTTAKQCQSAVHQYGREGMLSELYGVTGWDYDFRGHKHQGDWQAALGVTVRVHHLSWYSMKGPAKRDYPASISYQSPWYKEYRYVEDHFARVNTALTRGKPYVRVAVVHPVESYWLHFGPNEQTQHLRDKLDDNFMHVTEWLLKGNIDFDYICESTLPMQCAKGGAPLKVGEMEYDIVVIPECETLRSTTLERLEAFKAAGGRLVFMGDAPKYEDAVPSDRGRALFDSSDRIAFSKGALLEALSGERTVEIRDNNGVYTTNLLHQIRRDTNGLWLFVAHCTEPYNKDVATRQLISIYVNGKYKPQLWDTASGEIKPIGYEIKNGRTRINASLYDYDSLLLFLEDTDEESALELKQSPAPVPLGTAPELVDYTLSEQNVLLLDMPRYALDNEELKGPEEMLRADAAIRARLGYPAGKTQPWVIPARPAEHTVTMEFTVHSDIDVAEPYLALEDADIAEIVWNGEAVKKNICGYYVDKAIEKVALPPVRKGENTLRVTIPFGERSNCEAMYLLGSFGVKVAGRRATLTDLPEKLAFDDLTHQGLPFYGGEVSYHIPIELADACTVGIRVPHYSAAVNAVAVDGERKAIIAYPP